ncbi:RNA 3'-terminal phosphate cyclase [Chloropicon primus]|nr:RNA 3'-terminal phosphate cyclase [Chloropicon primus]
MATLVEDEDEKGRLVIHGEEMEGGGQILRISSVIAAIWNKKHLCGLEFVQSFCGGEMTGLQVGSMEVEYDPKGEFLERILRGDERVYGHTHVVDVKTAGSCTLIMQTALPCLVASMLLGKGRCSSESKRPRMTSTEPSSGPGLKQTMVIRGGTDVPFAPLVDYIKLVLAPHLLDRFGIELKATVSRRGFFPKGKGEVKVEVGFKSGSEKPPRRGNKASCDERLESRDMDGFRTVIVCGGSDKDFNPQQRKAFARIMDKVARESLAEWIGKGTSFEATTMFDGESLSPGLGVVFAAHMQDGRILGSSTVVNAKGKWQAQLKPCLGELADALRRGSEVDDHLQDQLLVFMALLRGIHGVRCGRPTMHTRTAVELMNRMLVGDGVHFEGLPSDDLGETEAAHIACTSAGCCGEA